jgi:hypothetical protein
MKGVFLTYEKSHFLSRYSWKLVSFKKAASEASLEMVGK